MSFFIIFILIPISLQDLPYLELPQFGEIQLKQQSFVSLELQGYNIGDEIYLEIIYINSNILILYTEDQFLTSRTLDVWENNKVAFNQETQQYITEYKYLKESLDDYHIYYTIKLKSNYNKLYFITPKVPFEEYPDIDEFNPFREYIKVTLKHNKTNYNQIGTVKIIILSVFIGLIIIGVAVFIYIFIKKRRKRDNTVEKTTPVETPLVTQI